MPGGIPLVPRPPKSGGGGSPPGFVPPAGLPRGGGPPGAGLAGAGAAGAGVAATVLAGDSPSGTRRRSDVRGLINGVTWLRTNMPSSAAVIPTTAPVSALLQCHHWNEMPSAMNAVMRVCVAADSCLIQVTMALKTLPMSCFHTVTLQRILGDRRGPDAAAAHSGRLPANCPATSNLPDPRAPLPPKTTRPSSRAGDWRAELSSPRVRAWADATRAVP